MGEVVELVRPPFSAKEWQHRAWASRLMEYVRRYIHVDQPMGEHYYHAGVIRNTVDELRVGPQPLPTTFRAFPERVEGIHWGADAAQRYIEHRYGGIPRITRYVGDDGYYGYADA